MMKVRVRVRVKPMFKGSDWAAGLPGGELGGAKLPIAMLPVLPGVSSPGTCGVGLGAGCSSG